MWGAGGRDPGNRAWEDQGKLRAENCNSENKRERGFGGKVYSDVRKSEPALFSSFLSIFFLEREKVHASKK